MYAQRVLLVVMAALLLGGAWRLVQIEAAQGSRLRHQAERQQTASWPIPAQRGDILDCRGRVLAGSVRRPAVFVDPALVENVQREARLVADALNLDWRELAGRIAARRERRFLWVKREVSEQELAAFRRVRRSEGLRAFVVRYEPARVYPYGRLAAHVLGFVGAEQHGLAGVELACDELLCGRDGRSEAVVDARRRPMRLLADDAYQPPVDGATVVLTIDVYLQQRTEHHLRDAFERHRPQWATAVVIDPQSGEVLAMATLPDFDPVEPIPPGLSPEEQQTVLERLRNRAVADAFEPGSVFKPFIAAPALEAGLTQLDELFAINGPARRFGSRVIHDVHAYDVLPLHRVISKSSNIGMGLLGARCGNERLYEFVRRFGFGRPTGIGLPGEHGGLVQELARWTRYSTQSIPIGQELAATPIQLVTAFCALCNDGILHRPRIVRGVLGPRGETIEDNSLPIPVRRVLSAEVAREFRRRALVEVVTDGTGKRAQLADYQVLGKTGTAQVARAEGGGYVRGAYVSSFVGAAPADEPRVVVLVTLYRPGAGEYYGGTVAAPVAAAIIADTLEYLRVPPDRAKQAPAAAEPGTVPISSRGGSDAGT